MYWEQPVQYASMSDIGFRRRNNQDSSAVQMCPDRQNWREHGHLFLVADGMGGHAVGELASKIAADTIPHTFFKSRELPPADALKRAIETANGAIHERGSHNRDFERMGTTCTVLVLSPQGAVVGHVGDSRLYRIRGERIEQLTFDHSLQWELLKQGRMKPEEIFLHEPRNVITRSLGPEPSVKVDIEGPYAVLPGDTYLLCSDGLTGHVNDAEIGAIARALPPGEASRLLVNLANLRGGSDNVTVVIVRVGNVPAGLEAGGTSGATTAIGDPAWWWLLAFWVIGLAFVGGVSLTLLGRFVAGTLLAALSIVSVVGLLGVWWFQRPRRAETDPRSAETIVWRPYRSASAALTRRFLGELAALEAELQRTAGEEGWSLDGDDHETARQRAKTAVAAGRDAQALADYARSIDALMVGLHRQRRQLRREAKRRHPEATEKRSSGQ